MKKRKLAAEVHEGLSALKLERLARKVSRLAALAIKADRRAACVHHTLNQVIHPHLAQDTRVVVKLLGEISARLEELERELKGAK